MKLSAPIFIAIGRMNNDLEVPFPLRPRDYFLLQFCAVIQTSAVVGPRLPTIFNSKLGSAFSLGQVDHQTAAIPANSALLLHYGAGLSPSLTIYAVQIPLPIPGLYVPTDTRPTFQLADIDSADVITNACILIREILDEDRGID